MGNVDFGELCKLEQRAEDRSMLGLAAALDILQHRRHTQALTRSRQFLCERTATPVLLAEIRD